MCSRNGLSIAGVLEARLDRTRLHADPLADSGLMKATTDFTRTFWDPGNQRGCLCPLDDLSESSAHVTEQHVECLRAGVWPRFVVSSQCLCSRNSSSRGLIIERLSRVQK
eukprot:scaffold168773_cov36-Tisochrysis_lutea.AAC.1